MGPDFPVLFSAPPLHGEGDPDVAEDHDGAGRVVANDGDEDDEGTVLGRLPFAEVGLTPADAVNDTGAEPHGEHGQPRRGEERERGYNDQGYCNRQ